MSMTEQIFLGVVTVAFIAFPLILMVTWVQNRAWRYEKPPIAED